MKKVITPFIPAALVAAKGVSILVCFAAWWTVYEITNRRGCIPGMAASFTRPVDVLPGIIQPWTAVIYVFGGLALPVLPFWYYKSWSKLRFVLTCYLVAAMILFVCYWRWPIRIDRPSFEGAGVGRWLMRHVVSVDGAANCTPSSHVCYAVLAALLVVHARPGRSVLIGVCALAAAVSITTVTTGQHYWIDIAAGVAAALIVYALGTWMAGRGSGTKSSSDSCRDKG